MRKVSARNGTSISDPARHLHCADRALPQTRSRWARPSPSKRHPGKDRRSWRGRAGQGHRGHARGRTKRAVAAEAKRTLKAAVYHRYGPPDVVRIEEVPTPHPKANELLVKVRATTVSAGDSRLRSGARVPPGFGLLMRLGFGFSGPRRPILGLSSQVKLPQSEHRSRASPSPTR